MVSVMKNGAHMSTRRGVSVVVFLFSLRSFSPLSFFSPSFLRFSSQFSFLYCLFTQPFPFFITEGGRELCPRPSLPFLILSPGLSLFLFFFVYAFRFSYFFIGGRKIHLQISFQCVEPSPFSLILVLFCLIFLSTFLTYFQIFLALLCLPLLFI